MQNTVYRFATEFPARYFIPPAFRKQINMHWKLIWTGTFQNRFQEKPHAIHLYNEHNERVKNLVPKEKLLILDVTKNGGDWKELCEFLGVKEPPENILFPHANDTKDFARKIEKMNSIGWTVIFICSSILVVVVAYLLYFFLS